VILVGALFLLVGVGEEKERKTIEERKKKKIAVGKEGFLGAGPTLLAVQQVTAARYN
jgi:hypothetical protein